MKKLLYIFFLLPICSLAQDSTSHVFYVGISHSSDLSYRLSKADGEVSSMKNEFDSLESSTYGYTAGLFAGYNLNASLSVRAGLQFSRYGYAIDTLEEVGFTQMHFKYSYIELPIRISHVFKLQRKVQPIVSVGLFAGYLIQQKTTHFATGEPLRKTYTDDQNLSPLNLGLIGSVGFQKNITSNYRIQLEGVFRQSLTSIGDTPFKRYLFSTGLNISLLRLF